MSSQYTPEHIPADAKRVDICSDTHGTLSAELVEQLQGADLIIHAGDITSEIDFDCLEAIAPVKAVLGNNDWHYDYGSAVGRVNTFEFEGLNFSVAHYKEDLPVDASDVAICGHTHVPQMKQVGKCLVLNPGSASYPRSMSGPTMARLWVKDGYIYTHEVISLM